MILILKSFAVAVFVTAGTAAVAGERAVALKVDGMTCYSCPYIVKQTLVRIDGVNSVDVSFEKKTAFVIFDDSRTRVEELTAATTDMGFPSALKE